MIIAYRKGHYPSATEIPGEVADLTREAEQLSSQIRVLQFLLAKIGSDVYGEKWETVYKEYKELAEL